MHLENSRCSIFLRHYGQNLRRAYGTQRFPNPHMLRIQNGCAIIWIFVRSIIFPTGKKRVFLGFSTNNRKRSKPRRNNSRRHTRSRCMTSLCASGIPTAMSLRSKKTIPRRRLSMYAQFIRVCSGVKTRSRDENLSIRSRSALATRGDPHPCRPSRMSTNSSVPNNAKPTSMRCGGKIARSTVPGARVKTFVLGARTTIGQG
jgi:hypothetical protein